jgi:hypothetical protein
MWKEISFRGNRTLCAFKLEGVDVILSLVCLRYRLPSECLQTSQVEARSLSHL